AGTLERMTEHFQQLLQGIVLDPEQHLAALPLLTQAEQQQLLVEWNATERTYPQDCCLHELFEEQVERTPEAVAVVFEEQHLTYADLNRRANQLAHYLQGLGIVPEGLVGICMERCLDMVVGLLGILKAGGAYVPLDPAYPKERLAFMVADSQVAIVLTHQFLQGNPLAVSGVQVISLDTDWKIIVAERHVNPHSGVVSDNLAYVIYTSGSTGWPKGTLVTHRNVTNFFTGMDQRLGKDVPGIWLAVTSISFDISVLELFWTLTRGFQVVVYETSGLLGTLSTYLATVERLKEMDVDEVACLVDFGIDEDAVLGSLHELDKLRQYSNTNKPVETISGQIRRLGITHLQCTPSLADMVVLEPEALSALGSLQKLLLGGEALPVSLAKQLGEVVGGAIHNMYGPTETTIWSTTHTVEHKATTMAIGRPIANTQVYILDRWLQTVPVGVAGELYIGGVGVARGYLNQSKLTAERFVPNPFSITPGMRLYRTGDLVRYSPEGNLEFLGRFDAQVKLRGFRIELEEIETVLEQHPMVREAVVVIRETEVNAKQLVAYLVFQQGETPSQTALRSFVQQRLPEYMVPAIFVSLEILPLTPNGKRDRRALPIPNQIRSELNVAYVAPQTPVEEMLADIWIQVLGVKAVGIHDNFFTLGGHSLLATQVVSRIQTTFQMGLSLRQFFESPTIGDLAALIINQERTAYLQANVKTLPESEVESLLYKLLIEEGIEYE
ncbi:MAG TPA: AMP-binding protein, partial [Ktedonobacteraceae bacterium]